MAARGRSKPSLLFRDQMREGLRVIASNPRRQLPAVVAICVGLAAALTVLAVAEAGAEAVDREFQRIRATDVAVRLSDGTDDGLVALPDGIDQRVNRLDGVVAAGVITPVGPVTVETVVTTSSPQHDITAVSLSGGAVDLLLDTSDGTAALLASWFDRSESPVVAVGAGAARRLGLSEVDSQQVFINGVAFTVAAIVDASARRPDLVDAVLVPRSSAKRFLTADVNDAEILVETLPGWAAFVGERVPFAVLPGTPERLDVTVQPEPARLSEAVADRTRSMVLAVAAVAILAGLLAISNSVTSSVVERTGELSMRRVFGARASHLQRHVLTESVIIGLVGGAAGVVVAWNVSMALVAIRRWEPHIDIAIWALGPVVGVLCGTLAGVVPAWRAGRIDPAEGIRRG